LKTALQNEDTSRLPHPRPVRGRPAGRQQRLMDVFYSVCVVAAPHLYHRRHHQTKRTPAG